MCALACTDSARACGFVNPIGSCTAHGQTTSGGVSSLISTTSHSACRPTGPTRPLRHASHTSAASTEAITRFWNVHQSIGNSRPRDTLHDTLHDTPRDTGFQPVLGASGVGELQFFYFDVASTGWKPVSRPITVMHHAHLRISRLDSLTPLEFVEQPAE